MSKRIDKLLSNLGLVTRSKALEYIHKHKVTVEGRIPKSVKVTATPSQVQINGEPLKYFDDLHIMLHKPRGYVCSRKREGETRIIYDLLPSSFIRRRPLLVSAGRLDKWASGLLVLSQSGQVVQNLTSPKRKTTLGKQYEVQLQKPITGEEAGIFASGELMLRSETEPCLPALFEVIDKEERLVSITLYEGRYHQLRRMLAAIGNRAMSIKRYQTGPLHLGDLPVGHWRELTKEEVDAILNI